MAVGAVWMVVFKFIERGLGLISTLVLARLLIPDDFGLVAMAMSIIALLELLTGFGFEIALIQNQKSERSYYDTAWTLNILFGAVSTVVLLLLAKPAAIFYHEVRLELVIYWLAVANFTEGFENIGVVAFRKEMTFDKEFKFRLGKKLFGFCITIPLAFYLQSYWALIIGIIFARLSSTVLSYFMHPYRPRLSLENTSELFHFSKWLLVSNVLTFMKMRSTDFIIGRLAGARSLGLYSIAYEIATLPTTELAAPINRAVFPGYSKMSGDLGRLRKGYLDVMGLIALFSLPAGGGIAATANILVPVLLGANWMDAIPLIQILAWYGILAALHSNSASVYFALGKPKVMAFIGLVTVLVQIPLVVVFAYRSGPIGAALAYFGAAVVLIPIHYYVVLKILKLNLFKFLAILWRPTLATGSMYFAVDRYVHYFTDVTTVIDQIAVLLTSVLLGVIIYSIVLFLLWVVASKPSGAENILGEKLVAKFPKLQFLNSR